MTYLIDTNIISEVARGSRCHPGVAAWFGSVEDDSLYLSALVLGEIRKGMEKAQRRDPAKAQALALWLEAVRIEFAGRILPVDERVAEEWGKLSAGRAVPVIDCLLVATARVNGLVLVTRNLSDMAGLDVTLLDPFDLQSGF